MKKNKSIDYHDKIAERYDTNYTDKKWEIHGAIEWAKADKYLPKKKCRILDAGGGTGEFSVKFAKKGNYVVLTDLSEGMLKIARRKIKKLNLGDSIRVLKQDITQMKDLGSNSFDFVVALGDPVSYCLDESKAIKELARVAKKGAYVLITVDSYFRQITLLLNSKNYKGLDQLEKTGNTTFLVDFTQHNFQIDELRTLFERNHLAVVEIFGLLNFVNKVNPKQLNKILSNKKRFTQFLNLEMKYCNEPSIIGFASHIGIVGRKK